MEPGRLGAVLTLVHGSFAGASITIGVFLVDSGGFVVEVFSWSKRVSLVGMSRIGDFLSGDSSSIGGSVFPGIWFGVSLVAGFGPGKGG